MKKIIPILLCGFSGLLMSNSSIGQVNIEFKLSATGNDVNIFWVAEYQADVETFVIHRSSDGRNFQLVTSVTGTGMDLGEYSYDDIGLPNGEYAYRLQLFFRDGSQELVGYEIVSVNSRPVIVNSSAFPDAIRANSINQ